ncbi:MAG: GNAT family N-acetyltransferase [Deltaproteobacteria bacterium]|nr:GNAT family N-acetyltransferase [Deltaproteobacteria bacterium]
MYEFRETEVSESHIIRLSELLTLVFGKKQEHGTSYLKWQYQENPYGTALGFDAFYEGQLAAHYVTIPIKAILNGNEARGLLSLNTATHPDHRSKGLFTALAEKTYVRAKESGYEFVVGVANGNSTHGFTRKLGFDLVTPLSAKIGLGNPSVERKSHVKFKLLWDKDGIFWRLRRPGAVYSMDKNHNVYGATKIAGIHAYLGPHMKLAPDSSLPHLKAVNPLRLWIKAGDDESLNPCYVRIPDFLKPSPLNLIFRSLTQPSYKLEPSDVEFYLSDFDAY